VDGQTGTLNWRIDVPTRAAVRKYPPQLCATKPMDQYQGHGVDLTKIRLGDEEHSQSRYVICSPARIIEEFKGTHYLFALGLTISWGTMDRTKNLYVYRDHSLEHIRDTLDHCAQSILQTSSIEKSWDLLTNGLCWSNVMTSKTLHFLCRSLNFEHNPPVPIDKARILEMVWPRFRNGIPKADQPQGWVGNDFAAYCRYMTVILELCTTEGRNWTTTQLESTITAEVDISKSSTPCA
jgi:hypothetical protein